MGAITGFGGVFLRANDPKALYAWYEKHLGLVKADGAFSFAAPTKHPQVVFALFKPENDYFPAAQKAMINLQVDDLDGVLDRLIGEGVAVDKSATATILEIWLAHGSGRKPRGALAADGERLIGERRRSDFVQVQDGAEAVAESGNLGTGEVNLAVDAHEELNGFELRIARGDVFAVENEFVGQVFNGVA